MKYLVYLALAASLIALIGFAMNPYGAFGGGIRAFNAEVDYTALLFQVSSWIAFVGGALVFFWNLKKDRKLKIMGATAAGIPLAIFIFRYGILILCFLPGAGDRGCL